MRINRTRLVYAALLSISLGAFAAPVFADDAPAAQSADQLNQQKNLEGHIQDEATTLESGLKDLFKSLHHLKRSSYDMFVEVQRQDMVVVGEPDVIGPIVIPAMPNVSGMIPMGGYLPPRKKFLDYFMAQIEDLLKMTQTEVKALVLPDDANDDAKTDLQTIQDAMAAMPQHVTDLDTATQGPKYDNMTIAKCSAILQNDVDAMEKAAKRLNSQAKKEVDKAKKDVRDLDKAIKKEAAGK